VLNGGGDGLDDESGGDGKGHVIGISRLWDDDLVARVEAGEESEEDGFGTAGGDDDIVDGEGNVKATVIIDEAVAEGKDALGRGIFEDGAVDGLERSEGVGRGVDVGLTDIEVVNENAVLLSLVGKRDELTDGRRGHGDPAV
jgi:hypothetical protein